MPRSLTHLSPSRNAARATSDSARSSERLTRLSSARSSGLHLNTTRASNFSISKPPRSPSLVVIICATTETCSKLPMSENSTCLFCLVFWAIARAIVSCARLKPCNTESASESKRKPAAAWLICAGTVTTGASPYFGKCLSSVSSGLRRKRQHAKSALFAQHSAPSRLPVRTAGSQRHTQSAAARKDTVARDVNVKLLAPAKILDSRQVNL